MRSLRHLNENWFKWSALVLGLILVVNLVDGFSKLDLLWRSQTDRSLVTDPQKWRAWLDEHADLLAALEPGAQIGITQDFDSDYGVLWTKQEAGIVVQRTNRMREMGPGVVFEFDNQVARDWQWKKNKEEALVFLRHRVQIGKIQAYYLKKQEQLQAQGFLTFLRELGLRPIP